MQGIRAMQEMLSPGKKPKVADRRYLRPDEAQRLVVAAGSRGRYPFRDKVLVRMIYRHGLRASEATGLRWSQIDLETGTIHIARVKGSKASTHSMDRDELRDLRKLRREVTGLYVFETERGGPLSSDAIQYIVREAGKLAQLDVEAHPHMLRHAAGYCLANDGVDTRLIQEYLGHKDIRHTVRYTELSPKRLAAVRVR
ncbi:MAG: tyrosine-type recombinase/integrase [Acetobacteraceae bacterium]|nr:tyrosine-type recombinase/integrase [Acetobacteraceae bacterium]